jgi:hypothetical protein
VGRQLDSVAVRPPLSTAGHLRWPTVRDETRAPLRLPRRLHQQATTGVAAIHEKAATVEDRGGGGSRRYIGCPTTDRGVVRWRQGSRVAVVCSSCTYATAGWQETRAPRQAGYSSGWTARRRRRPQRHHHISRSPPLHTCCTPAQSLRSAAGPAVRVYMGDGLCWPACTPGTARARLGPLRHPAAAPRQLRRCCCTTAPHLGVGAVASQAVGLLLLAGLGPRLEAAGQAQRGARQVRLGTGGGGREGRGGERLQGCRAHACSSARPQCRRQGDLGQAPPGGRAPEAALQLLRVLLDLPQLLLLALEQQVAQPAAGLQRLAQLRIRGQAGSHLVRQQRQRAQRRRPAMAGGSGGGSCGRARLGRRRRRRRRLGGPGPCRAGTGGDGRGRQPAPPLTSAAAPRAPRAAAACPRACLAAPWRSARGESASVAPGPAKRLSVSRRGALRAAGRGTGDVGHLDVGSAHRRASPPGGCFWMASRRPLGDAMRCVRRGGRVVMAARST